MIAGINGAVVFHGHRIPAGFGKYAQSSGLANSFGEADFEGLNENSADVFTDPRVEDRCEKVSLVSSLN